MDYSINDKGNIEEIRELFTTTFSNSEGPSEGQLIGNLAYDLLNDTDSQDMYCFIASENDQITGCIFFTRLIFESGVCAFLLAPVAVHTRHQGKGIGQKLIHYGLATLKENNVELVFTYGDPNYYTKVGFQPVSEEVVKAPLKLTYPEGWLALSLVGGTIEPVPGSSKCVEAISKPEYW